MREINVTELAGYHEEPEALRRFERPYVFVSLLGIALLFGGFTWWLITANLQHLLLCPLGGVVFALSTFALYRAHPSSPRTGRPLEKFRYVGPDAAPVELIYVDRDSKSYVRRVFIARAR